jgi:hypothetical protein
LGRISEETWVLIWSQFLVIGFIYLAKNRIPETQGSFFPFLFLPKTPVIFNKRDAGRINRISEYQPKTLKKYPILGISGAVSIPYL